MSFQQKINDLTKEASSLEQMAISLKLSDRQIFGLKSIRNKYATQLNKIDIFNIEDATILQKLDSLNEDKIKFFLGKQLYEQKMELTKTLK